MSGNLRDRKSRPARAERTAALAALALAGALAAAAGPAEPATSSAPSTPVPEARDYGALLYRIYCLNCHGESGRGDGPTAEYLTVPPADLTLIRRRNGGRFPEDDIYRVIDGRRVVPAHGRREMPIWGLGFQQPDIVADQEHEVRVRIEALIRYLQSIQRSAD